MTVRWLFFDVGTTLVDETAAYDRRARETLKGSGIPFAAFDEKRRDFAKQGKDGNAEAIRFFGLVKTPWPVEEERLYPAVPETLRNLKSRGYRLGVIANQAPGLSERLKAWGLDEFFDVVVSSSEVGVSKPDRAIFARALSLAECHPEQAVMIGDRPDNDLVPAKALGMGTVWVRQGLAALMPEDCPAADCAIPDLAAVAEIFPGRRG
ncbi:MAG: HAD family hydrolase [Clostridia bacterium]|nr:HAD family hydrolase [Clostridia bacterium]